MVFTVDARANDHVEIVDSASLAVTSSQIPQVNRVPVPIHRGQTSAQRICAYHNACIIDGPAEAGAEIGHPNTITIKKCIVAIALATNPAIVVHSPSSTTSA